MDLHETRAPRRPVGGRVALFTYGHAEPFQVQLMNWAQEALIAQGFPAQEGYEYRRWFADRTLELTQAHATAIVEWKPDIVLSFMTNADLALLKATEGTGIPIVCWSMDPVGAGIVQRPERPEGNLTGVALPEPLARRQLDVLLQIKPGMERLAVLHNPTYAIAPPALRYLQDAAGQRGLLVRAYECLRVGDIASTLEVMRRDGFDAAIVGPHEVFNTNGRAIVEAAAASGIATVGMQSLPDNGGLAGFAPDFQRIWARAAELAASILRGAPVSQAPFDRSIPALLTVNPDGIERLGLTVSPELRAMADRILSEP